MTHSTPPLYPLLRARVDQAGLFRKAGLGELPYILFTASCYVSGGLLLWQAGDRWWGVIAAALVLAVGYGQAGLLGHDLGHVQVFRNQPWSLRVGALVSLAMGSAR